MAAALICTSCYLKLFPGSYFLPECGGQEVMRYDRRRAGGSGSETRFDGQTLIDADSEIDLSRFLGIFWTLTVKYVNLHMKTYPTPYPSVCTFDGVYRLL